MVSFCTKNLGCRVNRAELDAVTEDLLSFGHTYEDAANILILNSCCVTNEALAKTRKAIRHALSQNPKLVVYVFGCAAKLYKDEISAIEPLRVHVCVSADDLKAELQVHKHPTSSTKASSNPYFYRRPDIKIQDGCDKRCSYCCVWQARGPARSLPLPDVLNKVSACVAKGAQEVVLCGIDIGSYNAGGVRLPEVVEAILENTAISRVRLSSIEPTSLTEELFCVIANSKGRVAPYLHVPLQSGSDNILVAMKRTYSAKEYLAILKEAKRVIPSLATSTDIIVGFPGETQDDFFETEQMVKEVSFSNLHIFPYSKRENTNAAKMDEQVSAEVKKERSRHLHSLAKELKHDFASQLIGTPVTAVLENSRKGVDEHLLEVRLLKDVSSRSYVSGIVQEVEGETLVILPTHL